MKPAAAPKAEVPAEGPLPIPAQEVEALRTMFAYLKQQHPAATQRLEAVEAQLLSLSAQQFFAVADLRQAAINSRTPEQNKAYDQRLAADPEFFITEAARDVAKVKEALPQFNMSESQAPAEQMSPEKQKLWHRVGISIGTAVGVLFGYGFMRKAASLIAAGKPVGFFLGKVAPVIGGAMGAWSLHTKITKDWSAKGNDRKWDDVIRMAGDGLQIAGTVAAFVPAAGLVAGLGLQLAGTVVTWLGEMFNDAIGKKA